MLRTMGKKKKNPNICSRVIIPGKGEFMRRQATVDRPRKEQRFYPRWHRALRARRKGERAARRGRACQGGNLLLKGIGPAREGVVGLRRRIRIGRKGNDKRLRDRKRGRFIKKRRGRGGCANATGARVSPGGGSDAFEGSRGSPDRVLEDDEESRWETPN